MLSVLVVVCLHVSSPAPARLWLHCTTCNLLINGSTEKIKRFGKVLWDKFQPSMDWRCFSMFNNKIAWFSLVLLWQLCCHSQLTWKAMISATLHVKCSQIKPNPFNLLKHPIPEFIHNHLFLCHQLGLTGHQVPQEGIDTACNSYTATCEQHWVESVYERGSRGLNKTCI